MELSAFEYVARKKLRFTTPKGSINLEDLFDLPLTSEAGKPNLNEVAKFIHRGMAVDETSFVPSEASTVDLGERMKLEAVKRVIAIKVAERAAASEARDKAGKREEILAALAEAERGALKSKTPEELRALLAGL